MIKKTKVWGITSLILSLLSLFLFLMPYIGLPLAILAVVFAIKQEKIEPTGVATSGLVIGIIGILINVLMLIFVVGIFAIMFGASTHEKRSTFSDGTTQNKNEEAVVKVKNATIRIDRVTETAANLGNIRITVTNTGDFSIIPRFDVSVFDSSKKIVCEGNPWFGIGLINAGETITREISVMCMFKEDGEYIVKVDMLDEDYKKLASAEKKLIVDYWNMFHLS